nr:helix-turn-helix domain-containing protein [uncultured Roseateles sp.]
MANLVPKVSAEQWLATARLTLIEDGIDAVKVDRLAQRIGVTRGGFYHHFADRGDLLERLLADWETNVEFVPTELKPVTAAQALEAIDALVAHLVAEQRYDPRFDMAVRAWAHADPKIDRSVQRSDLRRLAALENVFLALGCDAEESLVRARVFYFHQIGYYATGLEETRQQRVSHLQTYVRILCGEGNLERARKHGRKARA